VGVGILRTEWDYIPRTDEGGAQLSQVCPPPVNKPKETKDLIRLSRRAGHLFPSDLGFTVQIVLSPVDSFQNGEAVSCPWVPDSRGGFLAAE
jgi:hypothetical protein